MTERASERSGGPPGGDPTSLHVGRALGGDPASVAWITRRFGPLLLSQARYRLARHPGLAVDPEDLVQDVWLAVLPKLGALAARDGRMTPVLVRFLGTTLQNRYRTLLQKLVQGKPLREPLDPALPGDATSVPTSVADREDAGRLADAIDALGDLDRQIVVLRALEETPAQDVGRMLDMAPNTVTVRYRRAIRKLREAFPESVFGELDADA